VLIWWPDGVQFGVPIIQARIRAWTPWAMASSMAMAPIGDASSPMNDFQQRHCRGGTRFGPPSIRFECQKKWGKDKGVGRSHKGAAELVGNKPLGHAS
jgi:hypothetical protein